MKRFIFYFLILLISIWLGVKIFHNPGYVLITNQEWVIETSLWFAILASLLLFFFIYFFIRLIVKTFHIPERIHKWRIKYRLRKSRKYLYAAIDDYLQGKWRKSEKTFLKSTKAIKFSVLGYLGAAKAAYGRKLFHRGNHYLVRAKKHCPSMSLAMDIALIKLQIEQGFYLKALETLTILRKEHPKHRYLLELTTDCYIQLNDWDNLSKLLPEIKKARLFPEEKLQNLEKEIYLHVAKQSISDYLTALDWWKKLPAYLRKNPEILAVYTFYLKEFKHDKEAEKLLRKYLSKNWNETLFEQYVTLNSPEPANQISFAEKCLSLEPDNPRVLRSLGKLCLRNQLWGQARDYLEKSLKLEKSKESYCLLGYVMEKIGDTDAALDNYRKGCS